MEEGSDTPNFIRVSGLVGGPLLGAVAALWALQGNHLQQPGALTLGVLVWMAMWWMTSAVDLAITSLLPVLLFPLMGVGTLKETTAPYADSVIFLFAGGALLGRALEVSGLSGRFAGRLLRLAGSSPRGIVVAMFAASALVSAWVSNTATAAMLLPVGIATIHWAKKAALPGHEHTRALRNFATGVLLAIAYGANVGGLLTIIGSPPNAIAAESLARLGQPVDFARWLRFGAPAVALLGPLVVVLLLAFLPMHGLRLRPAAQQADGGDPGGAGESPGSAGESPGSRARTRLSRAEWITTGAFMLAVVGWIAHPFITWIPKGRVSDAAVAVGVALLLFVLPVRVRPWTGVLRGDAFRSLPWGVLILFGGGLSLAEAMQRTGLSQALGESFSGLHSLPQPLVIFAVVAGLAIASEIASNTALTATAVPILVAMAPDLGIPAEKLVIPAAFGASCAFMMPVGTPPNAMAYATGMVPLSRMLRVGLVLDLVCAAVVTLLTMLLLG